MYKSSKLSETEIVEKCYDEQFLSLYVLTMEDLMFIFFYFFQLYFCFNAVIFLIFFYIIGKRVYYNTRFVSINIALSFFFRLTDISSKYNTNYYYRIDQSGVYLYWNCKYS